MDRIGAQGYDFLGFGSRSSSIDLFAEVVHPNLGAIGGFQEGNLSSGRMASPWAVQHDLSSQGFSSGLAVWPLVERLPFEPCGVASSCKASPWVSRLHF
ncbi:hypothetical protein TorRG33x02_331700 [Trema orientale]|uniref:Uncharacterized protein n=1 Tax=Trema orientale TaxID=63057 RepID=A0A2P5B5R4_TREOI|nr:hypothetical protein TorRG33x02_331700 [Trema orientale]